MENQKKLGASAFLPLIVFLALYVGCGITFTLMGAESPFGFFPRHVALLFGLAVGCLLVPGVKIDKKVDVFCENMGNPGVMMVILLYLMAGNVEAFTQAAVIEGDAELLKLFAENLTQISNTFSGFNIVEP